MGYYEFMTLIETSVREKCLSLWIRGNGDKRYRSVKTMGVYYAKKSLFFPDPKSRNAPPSPSKLPKNRRNITAKGKFFSKFLILPRNPSKKSLFFPPPPLPHLSEYTPMIKTAWKFRTSHIGLLSSLQYQFSIIFNSYSLH